MGGLRRGRPLQRPSIQHSPLPRQPFYQPGTPLGNDGTVPFRHGERVDFK